MKPEPRLMAVSILSSVLDGRSLGDVLAPALSTLSDARDQAFVQALCYGVCRWYWRLDAIVNTLLKKPLKAKDQDIHILLMMGIYQLSDMRVPDYAAISETVEVVHRLKKEWAKSLVNGVLRAYQRKENKDPQTPAGHYAHPPWMIEKIKQDWPKEWESILNANNQAPPFSLRVNRQKLNREMYLKKLQAQDIAATMIPETSTGVVVTQPLAVNQLPGFSEGEVSVQDGAAQLAAELLLLAPQQRVLDACAAPGGKTMHMLETEPSLNLLAVDKSEQRLAAIKDNSERLGLNVTCLCDDAANLTSGWQGQLFDRILLDAPCSGSGVIRRHPDIKLLREPLDIAASAEEQYRLLEALWPALQSGGVLVYSTCSIFKEENGAVIQQFLHKHTGAKEMKIEAAWGIACETGRQILPGMHNMDGFYYARLRK